MTLDELRELESRTAHARNLALQIKHYRQRLQRLLALESTDEALIARTADELDRLNLKFAAL